MKVKYFRTSTRSIYLICIICKFSWECLWANNWLKFRCHLSWSSSEIDFVTRVKFHHVDTYLTHVPQFCHIFRSPYWAPNNATETHDNFYFVTLWRRWKYKRINIMTCALASIFLRWFKEADVVPLRNGPNRPFPLIHPYPGANYLIRALSGLSDPFSAWKRIFRENQTKSMMMRKKYLQFFL